jgi:hypothetical protein
MVSGFWKLVQVQGRSTVNSLFTVSKVELCKKAQPSAPIAKPSPPTLPFTSHSHPPIPQSLMQTFHIPTIPIPALPRSLRARPLKAILLAPNHATNEIEAAVLARLPLGVFVEAAVGRAVTLGGIVVAFAPLFVIHAAAEIHAGLRFGGGGVGG